VQVGGAYFPLYTPAVQQIGSTICGSFIATTPIFLSRSHSPVLTSRRGFGHRSDLTFLLIPMVHIPHSGVLFSLIKGIHQGVYIACLRPAH